MRKMRISKVRNNFGIEREVYTNLYVGDKLRCKEDYRSLGRLTGIAYDYDAFIGGKIYEVDNVHEFNYALVAYVVDEDGTSVWATPDIFDVVELNNK